MHEPHVCAICRTVLDWWEPFSGGAGRWQHTALNAPADNHRAVPVPRRETTRVNTKCDYCGTPDPTFTFVLLDRVAMLTTDANGRVMDGSADDDGLWAACVDCAAIVETGSPARLTAHVARRLEAATRGPVSREVLYQMYVAHLAIPRVRVDNNEGDDQ